MWYCFNSLCSQKSFIKDKSSTYKGNGIHISTSVMLVIFSAIATHLKHFLSNIVQQYCTLQELGDFWYMEKGQAYKRHKNLNENCQHSDLSQFLSSIKNMQIGRNSDVSNVNQWLSHLSVSKKHWFSGCLNILHFKQLFTTMFPLLEYFGQ